MCDFGRRAKVTGCSQGPGSEFPDWAADAEDVTGLSIAAIDSKQAIHLSGICKTYNFFSAYETWAWNPLPIMGCCKNPALVSWTHLLAGDGVVVLIFLSCSLCRLLTAPTPCLASGGSSVFLLWMRNNKSTSFVAVCSLEGIKHCASQMLHSAADSTISASCRCYCKDRSLSYPLHMTAKWKLHWSTDFSFREENAVALFLHYRPKHSFTLFLLHCLNH